MKRLLSVLLVVFLIAAFTSCGMSEASRKKKQYNDAMQELNEAEREKERLERDLEDLERLQDQLDRAYGY